MFNLPTGYSVQVLWHYEQGDTCYEFYRAYRPSGFLDKDRSFWLIAPLDRDNAVDMEQLSYRECRSLGAAPAGSFSEFASPSQPTRHLREWLRRKHALLPAMRH
jgi:hypothetical protein